MKLYAAILAITLMALPAPGMAHGDEDGHTGLNQEHGKMNGAMKHSMKAMAGTFLVNKEIDGYQVSFHVMKARKDMQHGGTYNLMIKVEKDGRVLTDLLVNSKVSHPIEESESKMMVRMGDWYMAGYDLSHKGRHQIMVLFKTADGKKHFGGIYYSPEEANHD